MRARAASLALCMFALAACGDIAETEDAPRREDRTGGDVASSVDVADFDGTADAGVDDIATAGDVRPLDVRVDVVSFDAPREASASDGPALDAADCRGRLRALGVSFTVAGATMGVADPVNVTPPINDVHFRYASFTAADRPMLMDCRLALAVEALARQLRDMWQISDVVHLGTYNYRCIAGTDPCRMSQHAYGLAIDINAFRTRSGQAMSVTTDFVANGTPTCPPRASNAVDRTLKDIACWMYDSRTFTIILTPNYNAAHRDHFHVDLTPGSRFIGLPGPEGVDPMLGPGLPDMYIDDD